jgi:hydroxypyruvate isomerase
VIESALTELNDRPPLTMHEVVNPDLHHVQIGEGNLVELVERALPLVGEIRVAGVPCRCEFGSGEIHQPAIAATLDRLGYDRGVRPEGLSVGRPGRGLERFCSSSLRLPPRGRSSCAGPAVTTPR